MIRHVITLLTTLFPLALSAAPETSGEAKFHDCYARWSPGELVIGNALTERHWKIDDGQLTATSLRDQPSETEWLAKPAKNPAPSIGQEADTGDLLGSVQTGRFHPVEAPSLVLDLATADRSTRYRFQVFPRTRGIGMFFHHDQPTATQPQSTPSDTPDQPTGIERGPQEKSESSSHHTLEDLMLAPPHLKFTQVILKDQTDHHNQLVFENEWLPTSSEGRIELPGNLFIIENPLTRAGLIFLKLAPLPHARPLKSPWDARLNAGRRQLQFAGHGYPYVLINYVNGRSGRIAALQNYQSQLRQYDPQRDAMFLSNTWGDRSRDSRINEAFMLKEVEAGARLGVDVIQIDDGWQKGRSANSARGKGVWNGYWAADPNFWDPDPKHFPNGLAPVVRAAREHGMKFGLWYGPDSSHEAANWKRDADRILELHETHGINYFKLDSIKAQEPNTERNMHRFFNRALEKSNGQVVFDLDVTAEIRPGYFGAPHVGPIFVENRYTDWRSYWPHQTLRNLWSLAQYVDPKRLRMEFLNNTRNQNKYADDPLAPAHYPPDYLFASVMFANPLGWFEVSNLPDDYVAAVAPLVKTWKRERESLFSGTIIPIGDTPDGGSWTGFASVPSSPDRPGYLLLFREHHPSATWDNPMPLFGDGELTLNPLAGHGSATLKDGQLHASIPHRLNYLFLKVSPK